MKILSIAIPTVIPLALDNIPDSFLIMELLKTLNFILAWQ